MNKIKLLFVEDDAPFRQVTKDSLELTGEYEVCDAANGVDGYEAYKSFAPDVIVTDVDMPKMNGLDMINKIRKENETIPIIVASGLISPKQIGEGFKYDIDNYVKKPFLPAEIDLYIKAAMRLIFKMNKINQWEEKRFRLGDYLFDVKERCLMRNDEIQKLSPREVQLLHLLYENVGVTVKREDILRQFWGGDDLFQSRSLDVHIAKIRKYLEKDPSVEITTIRGEGLKLTL